MVVFALRFFQRHWAGPREQKKTASEAGAAPRFAPHQSKTSQATCMHAPRGLANSPLTMTPIHACLLGLKTEDCQLCPCDRPRLRSKGSRLWIIALESTAVLCWIPFLLRPCFCLYTGKLSDNSNDKGCSQHSLPTEKVRGVYRRGECAPDLGVGSPRRERV